MAWCCYRPLSTLAQVMACCLTAPSPYMSWKAFVKLHFKIITYSGASEITYHHWTSLTQASCRQLPGAFSYKFPADPPALGTRCVGPHGHAPCGRLLFWHLCQMTSQPSPQGCRRPVKKKKKKNYDFSLIEFGREIQKKLGYPPPPRHTL